MPIDKLKEDIGEIDIYLLDQILKERYAENAVILDAGCGEGRNLKWFYNNSYKIYGVDSNTRKIDFVKEKYKRQKEHFSVQNLDLLSFDNNQFDHIICNAVLHFAQNTQHFLNMFSELIRVLKHNGTLFIRMANMEGIKDRVVAISDGIYKLPDKTNRFLLTDSLLHKLILEYPIKMLEPQKSVYVNNERSMCTLVFIKIS